MNREWGWRVLAAYRSRAKNDAREIVGAMTVTERLRRVVVEMAATSPIYAALAVVLLIAVGATEGISVLLLVPLLNMVGVEGKPDDPIVDWFGSAFQFAGIEPTLGAVLVVYVVVVGIRLGLMVAQTIVNITLREEFTTRMRARLYRAIGHAEWKLLVTRRASEFVYLLSGEVGRVGVAAFKVVELGVAVGISLVYLAIAFTVSPTVAGMVLLCASVIGVVTRRQLARARNLGARTSLARNNLQTILTEHVASIKTAKSYGAIDRHAEIFVRSSHELRNLSLELAASESGLQRTLELAWTILFAVVVFGAVEIAGINAAQLVVALFVCARLMPRSVMIYRQLQTLASMLPVLEAVDQAEREYLAAAEPETFQVDLNPRGLIRFENVTFEYIGRAGTPAVAGLTMEIQAGLTTAIVGPSGAGKSTVVDLLIGLLKPTIGRILLDGYPMTTANLSSWRDSIGYVAQDTFLFHDTVRENIAWSLPGATDDAIWKALRLASADDFVAALPAGLDTVVGERGVMLSGGERQRLSLARALLRQPRVLLLDEATSSLDSETERRIQAAIESLHQRMTIVIVTHRVSMISGADSIYVLDGGRLVESGSWDTLLSSSQGRFRQLCRTQGIYKRPSHNGSQANLMPSGHAES